MDKILVTGAFGLLGSDLITSLQEKYGQEAVVAFGHSKISSFFRGMVEQGDVRDKEKLEKLIKKYGIKQIYHLAGLLSAGGEKNPSLAWDVNINSLRNILELGIEHELRVFWPSSMAVFGPTTPKEKTPQKTILEPTTIYGVTKVTGELLCQYYHQKYNLDVRSLRYPGVIGYKAEPGDGTTEYAISIFYAALKGEKFVCFLKENSVLPMMFMDDAIQGTIELMEANPQKIKVRTSYNFSALSFSPNDLYQEIKKHIPGFKIDYQPDYRQKIADSWPRTIDDSPARKDWGWQHQYNLLEMVEIMLRELKNKNKF